jgi:hypothetical protein
MFRFLKSSLGKAMFARVLLACVTSPVVFLHEMQTAAPQSVSVATDEGAFLKENEAAMTKMMNDMAAKPPGDMIGISWP